MSDAIDLDHLAVAAEHLDDLWPRYIGDLGGQWFTGGASPGFDWGQLSFANGMRVEALQPARVEQFDFLRRFLDRHGPAAHHLTFKVPDLDEILGLLAARHIEPARVDRGEPGWQEAFLHAADAWGIVAQLVQGDDDAPDETPPPLPRPRSPAAHLDHIALAVADLDAALRVYEDLLEGVPVHDGSTSEATWVELRWHGPGRLRLLHLAPGSDWLGHRPGRLHHVAFTVSRPGAVRGAFVRPDGSYEVAAQANHGVGLRLSPA